MHADDPAPYSEVTRFDAGSAMIIPRRRFLTGLATLIAAPAVVKADALMPIKVWRPTGDPLWGIPSFAVLSSEDPSGMERSRLAHRQSRGRSASLSIAQWPASSTSLCEASRSSSIDSGIGAAALVAAAQGLKPRAV